jgi:predicted CoA-substrate-specific enzyme activase
MYRLGIDMGASTIKLALLKDKTIQSTWMRQHHGALLPALCQGLTDLRLPEGPVSMAVTGMNSQILLDACPQLSRLGDIPAIVEGIHALAPDAGSLIEIGSQGARFVTDLKAKAPRFSVNEHCAGGTGSFFEAQMSRLDLNIEDYSRLAAQAHSIPRLSGRCAVFAKTDIIHRQQEGASTADILLGLCYAMIRNYKAVIVRDLPIHKPVAFCGGVTQNTGVVRAIREVFSLGEEELLIPDQAVYTAAIGAALHAEETMDPRQLTEILAKHSTAPRKADYLPPLVLALGTSLAEPTVTDSIPSDGCSLGIDIGSTSTDLVLIGRDGALVDFQYLRTAGDPEGAVRQGLESIRARFGELSLLAVGVTGSGRERLGKMLGADAVRDEITAQAKAAVRWVPKADTVFEIGGQDSKFISLKDGEVADFQMNKICAAGTGSFVEEQAARMNIPLEAFGPLALTSSAPAELGERCTVFIETAIATAEAQGASQADIAAGLCHSIVRNYLHKVVGTKPVGEHIVLQGGVTYNPGIVAAFQGVYGDRLTVSPCFSISGAYGAALLALEAVGDGQSHFRGFDFQRNASKEEGLQKEERRNTAFYQSAEKLLLAGYNGVIDPSKPTVGIPFVLMIHKFFPMANAFFKDLGFNVLLSDPTGEETIHLSQQYAQGETCYPVKLIYGHMVQLMERGVDYIFLPTIHTMKHETSHAAYNYGCVYMQTAPRSVANILGLEERGIKLLSPVFDLDFGKEAMASAMLSMGKELGIPKPRCMKALLAGAMAVRRHTEAVEKQGRLLLESLKPEDKVLVLITRNYGISDPILNMGIPELLLQRGYKVITLSHLPGHDLDISQDYPNLYWPFGQHILSGAKLVAHHPNLYAVYLTNHGCGPDTMLSHLFRQEMGEKPYLQIEVDEHFSKVGVITRIEAFLNSLSHRPTQPLPAGFDLKAVSVRPAALDCKPKEGKALYLPNLGWHTSYLAEYCKTALGVEAIPMAPVDQRILALGRTATNSKEYLPFPALLGGIFDVLSQEKNPVQFMIPTTLGAEADGQYPRAIRSILDGKGWGDVGLVSPTLEILPQTAADLDLLFRAILTGDLLYAAPLEQRNALQPPTIPTWEELHTLAKHIGTLSMTGRRLAAVGTPLCLTSLNESVLETLEDEGDTILRAPLSEFLWFLWQDNEKGKTPCLETLRDQMVQIAEALGERSPFAAVPAELTALGDRFLSNFAGGNGRYRYAKAVHAGKACAGVLHLTPRYENTAMVLEMRGLSEFCSAPLFHMALDGDWDMAAWSRLRSFLYYCKNDVAQTAYCPFE